MSNIFIGSTYVDLEGHRQAVAEVVRDLKHVPIGMENFPAGSKRTLDVCRKQVRSVDLFIAILGMRYGEIDLETDKSYTHHEINEANSLQLPILSFFIDEEKHLVIPKHVETGDGAKKLIDLKKELAAQSTPLKFTDRDDLATKCRNSLVSEIGHYAQQKALSLARTKRVLELFRDAPNDYKGIELTCGLPVGKLRELTEIEREFVLFDPDYKSGSMVSTIFDERYNVYASGDQFGRLKASKKGAIITAMVKTYYMADNKNQVRGLEVVSIY